MTAVWRGALAALAVLVAASALTAVAASNTVPSTSIGQDASGISIDDLVPPQCQGLNLTSIVAGSGNINGNTGNTLILGSPGVDTIKAKNGNDCILAGGGNDSIDGFPGYDVCFGGPGTDTFSRCEEAYQ